MLCEICYNDINQLAYPLDLYPRALAHVPWLFSQEATFSLTIRWLRLWISFATLSNARYRRFWMVLLNITSVS